MSSKIRLSAILILVCICAPGWSDSNAPRPRARDVGVRVGVLPTGPLNAITDVEGVEVGHTTLIRGDSVRTGVTAILPHGGNLFREKVPGAVYVGNGYGKLAGSTQVNELGEIETPIVLTSTLSVPRAADALIGYTLALPGNEDVRSVNAVVGETNDGVLNDIRGRHITTEDVLSAIQNAHSGPVEEGAVGAGTGTIAFGFKGGIGTSSRRLPKELGGYTVGVIVQSNYGGVLNIGSAPVGQELGRYYLKEFLADSRTGAEVLSALSKPAQPPEALVRADDLVTDDTAKGSIMMVVATDAPLDHRNLHRLAFRALLGMACTGSSASNSSGDYVIAFSTARELRMISEMRLHPLAGHPPDPSPVSLPQLSNDAMSPLFMAVIEATEEAIYNSLFRATTTTGEGKTVEALPIDETVAILRKYGVIAPAGKAPRPRK